MASLEVVLEKTELTDKFDAVSCGLDTTRSKPDPEVFLIAANKLGIAPCDCAVVEDSDAGIEAAKAGGNVPCVLNAANEVAVDAFLKGNISFTGIARLVEECMSKVGYIASPEYDDYVSTNLDARSIAEALLK